MAMADSLADFFLECRSPTFDTI